MHNQPQDSATLELTQPFYSDTHKTELSATKQRLPDYLERVYHWSYLSPRNVHLLDREWIVKLILWWQHNKLREAAFSDIPVESNVLQLAAVYGAFSQKLAQHIGSKGHLTVLDIAPIQVNITRNKLKNENNAEVHLGDASLGQLCPETNIVLSYFLLHEVPDSYKMLILDNVLAQLPKGSKLIIIDYHKPFRAHPLKPLMYGIFKWLEPFALSCWQREVSSFASAKSHFKWDKTTFFGGLYQKIVVSHL